MWCDVHSAPRRELNWVIPREHKHFTGGLCREPTPSFPEVATGWLYLTYLKSVSPTRPWGHREAKWVCQCHPMVVWGHGFAEITPAMGVCGKAVCVCVCARGLFLCAKHVAPKNKAGKGRAELQRQSLSYRSCSSHTFFSIVAPALLTCSWIISSIPTIAKCHLHRNSCAHLIFHLNSQWMYSGLFFLRLDIGETDVR